MSEKTIKLKVVGDTAQAKRDIDDLVKSTQSLPSIKVPLKTEGASEVLKSLADVRNEAKLLQSQFQGLKINGDVSQLSSVKTKIGEITKDLNAVPKSLDIKTQLNAQTISNSLQKINKEVKDLQNGKIDIKTSMSGSITQQIASIKASVSSIQKSQTVQIAIAGVSGALSAIGAIKNALGSLYNMASQPVGSFLSDGYDYTKGIESSTTTLTTALQNSARATNEANQRFNEGVGTMEDYATITGKTTESLYETVEASGGAGAAAKTLKADTTALKGELLALKQETQEYNREAKNEEQAKKELERATKDLVQGYKAQIDQIQDIISGIKDQENAALVRAQSTDREIKDLERLINVKEREIQVDEKRLNKDKSAQEKAFDKENKTILSDIAKKEIALDKQSLELQKRKNLLNNNPTGNAAALDAIRNEEEAIREQTATLRLQKDEIRLKKQELISTIETQQEAQRNLIENRKEELEKNKEIADAKKSQNEEIKNQFENQIDDQKKLIDDLKDKIEKANIKLDLDTKPIQDKIDTIKQKISELQEQSQDIQNEISDRQQAAAEASAGASGGGGGGGGKSLVPLVDIGGINAAKKGQGFTEITDGDITRRINRVIGESTAFALKTPFEKKDVIAITAQLEALQFNTLKGLEDKEKGIAGSKDISGAGYDNILNIASDFIARRLQITGGSSQEATKDFTRAIAGLKTGNTASFAEQFGTTGPQILNAAKSLGFKLEKQQDLANLNTDELTQVLAKTAEKQLIRGSAAAQVDTLQGVESNAKDAFNGLYEEFFGKPSDPKSLAGSIKESIKSFTDILSGPDSNELKKSFKELGTSLGVLLKEIITPENLKATFDGLKSVVDGMKSYLSPSNIKSFATAIGDFVKGIPNALKTFGDVIEGIASLLRIKTEKVKTKEADDYFNKKEAPEILPGVIDTFASPDKFKTKSEKAKDSISTFEKESKRLDNGEFVLRSVSEEDYKKAQEDMKKHLSQLNKDADEKRKEDLVNLKQNEEEKRNAVLETQRIIREEIVKTAQESKINFDTIAKDSQNGFITLTNGAKIQLSEIGATSKNTTDEIALKFNQLKDNVIQSFTDGRVLSEPQIKLLAEISGKTIDEIKVKNEEIKTNLQEKFKTGKELSAIELQELAKINNSTVEEITKKHKEIALEEKFRSGKELSEIELKELSAITGKSVENLKTEFAKLKEGIGKPVEDGIGQAKDAQKGLLNDAIKTGSEIQSAYNNIKLNNPKKEFLEFDNILQNLTDSARGAFNWLSNLGQKKGEVNRIPEPVANLAKTVGDFGSKLLNGKAEGGLITGGSGVRDDVPIMAMGGEYVLKKSAVNRYGLDILNQINEGRFNLNKIEPIRIPTAPSPKITNNIQNNSNSQPVQNISNIFNIPNNGGLDLKLKTTLDLFSDNLNRSASSGFANISV